MRAARHTVLLLGLASAISCATLRPHQGAAPAESASESASAQLTLIEGTPTGLVLRLTADVVAEQLVLYRAQEGEEPVALQSIELTDALQQALVDGVDIVDTTITPGTFQYQFALTVDAQVVALSPIADLAWREPPKRPELVARTAFSDAVELSWPTPEDARAAVFRRDVLDQSSEFVRVATVAAGQGAWVDRDVAAGQVWSYRVTLAFEQRGDFLQYGAASEEVYASTPEPK